MQNNVWKYYLFHTFLNLQLWWPIWIIYLTEERGLSLAQVTLIDVPFWLCIICLQVPGAALADRFGRKPTLIGAALLFSVAIVFFGLATTFWLLLVSYLIWGVGFSLLWGTESAFIYDSLKAMGREEEYPRIYGRGWAIAVGAQLAGTLIGAPLADATSLQAPIVASGAISALAAVVAVTFVEPKVAEKTHHPGYGEIIRSSASLVKRLPDVRYAILFFGIVTIGSIAVVFFFQPFLVGHDVDTGRRRHLADADAYRGDRGGIVSAPADAGLWRAPDVPRHAAPGHRRLSDAGDVGLDICADRVPDHQLRRHPLPADGDGLR